MGLRASVDDEIVRARQGRATLSPRLNSIVLAADLRTPTSVAPAPSLSAPSASMTTRSDASPVTPDENTSVVAARIRVTLAFGVARATTSEVRAGARGGSSPHPDGA